MRTSLYLKVEAQPGCSIQSALKDTAYIAKLLNVTVEFDFNGVKCLINPNADVELAEARWNDMLGSKREHKIISA
jgi:hypothetical protein